MATKKAVKKSVKKAVKEVKVRKQRTGTKLEAALAIVKDNPNLSRKSIIKLFQDKAKLTKAGSSTYWSLVQAKLKKK